MVSLATSELITPMARVRSPQATLIMFLSDYALTLGKGRGRVLEILATSNFGFTIFYLRGHWTEIINT